MSSEPRDAGRSFKQEIIMPRQTKITSFDLTPEARQTQNSTSANDKANISINIDTFMLTKADAERIVSRYKHIAVGQMDVNELDLVLGLKRFVEAP